MNVLFIPFDAKLKFYRANAMHGIQVTQLQAYTNNFDTYAI